MVWPIVGLRLPSGDHFRRGPRSTTSKPRCHLDVSSQVDGRAEGDVADVLIKFAEAVSCHQCNGNRTRVLPALLETAENLVGSAPTARGKTGIAGVAICAPLRAGVNGAAGE